MWWLDANIKRTILLPPFSGLKSTVNRKWTHKEAGYEERYG
jgi:hypothetical protein